MEALARAIQRVKVETKATNTYMVLADGKGGSKKVYTKNLYLLLNDFKTIILSSNLILLFFFNIHFW